MGFWSSFLGAGAAHVYNEMKKEERETKKKQKRKTMTKILLRITKQSSKRSCGLHALKL